jgi:ABC-type sugar transport system ATPase subunit
MVQLGSAVTDATRPVASLSGGQRQSVAIGRALRWNADVVIMDEPTAALGVRETAQVLDLIRALNGTGKTVVLISHNMADVVAVAHRVAILRQGRKVIDRPVAGLDADMLSHMVMTGRAAA